MSNGHSKTSRSGSVISIISNGTNISNGVLKNTKTSTMSPENLKQIENAFTTNRDEYAQFESSLDASAPKPIGENGVSKKTTVFLSEDETKKRKSESESSRYQPFKNRFPASTPLIT